MARFRVSFVSACCIALVLNLILACAVYMVKTRSRGQAGTVAQADAHSVAWVESREAKWSIRPAERAVDGIKWVDEIDEGLRLAKEQKRLVLVVVSNGSIRSGRT